MKENRGSFFRGALCGVVVTLLLAAGVAALLTSGTDADAVTTEAMEIAEEKLAEINEYIEDNFIFDIDAETLADSLISGYIEGLGDDYSVYYTAEEMDDVNESISGTYYGIGVTVMQDTDGTITVISVFSGSPAEEAGILAEDVIIGVDDMDVTEMDLNQVVAYIKGEEGTTVEITVSRDGESITMTVERREVEVDTVSYEMLEDGIGYLELTEFDDVSLDQMLEALEALEAQGMTGLILDLRDNPGGLLTSVLDIANLFLDGGNILYMEDKQGNRTDYDADDGVTYEGSLVVLVNGNSASAAEVLAGALKDHEVATLVGTTTFGKGIVQTYFTLSDGSAVKLTTAHYFTPSGTDIHGVGITPHIEVEADEDSETDVQLEAAIETLKELMEEE